MAQDSPCLTCFQSKLIHTPHSCWTIGEWILHWHTDMVCRCKWIQRLFTVHDKILFSYVLSLPPCFVSRHLDLTELNYISLNTGARDLNSALSCWCTWSFYGLNYLCISEKLKAGEMAQWVRAPDCSSEGPEFKSQQPHGGSQPSLTRSDSLFWNVWRQLQCTYI